MRDQQNLPIIRPALGLVTAATDPMGTSGLPHYFHDGTNLNLVSADGTSSVVPGGTGAGGGRSSINRGVIPSSRVAFSVNPTANDTLTFGGAAIKFVAALGGQVAQTQVKIGASAAATLAVVLNAVNGIVDAANITAGSTPLTAALIGAAILADNPTATALRIRLATARGGTAIAGVSASVALAASITGGASAWTTDNLNLSGKAEADVMECCGKVTLSAACSSSCPSPRPSCSSSTPIRPERCGRA
jgi:hypothetical protein